MIAPSSESKDTMHHEAQMTRVRWIICRTPACQFFDPLTRPKRISCLLRLEIWSGLTQSLVRLHLFSNSLKH